MPDGKPPKSALVAGGGIAGLASAIWLADIGMDVTVLERAPGFGEVGAGLQISPNATRILAAMGILDTLRQYCVEPKRLRLRAANTLKTLAEVELGSRAAERWGGPYLTAHRVDLHAALLEGVKGRAGVETFTSTAVERVDLDVSGVSVTAKNQEGKCTFPCDVAVGADGVWSVVRKQLTGSGHDRFSGYTAWRKTVPADVIDPAIISPMEVTEFLDPHGHLVAYPVSAGKAINLVAITKGRKIDKSWNVPSANDDLRIATENWHAAIKSAMAGQAEWLGWPIHTVSAGISWTDPRGLALVGDAAHAMTPFSAQGAVMAIEDAASLALSLRDKSGGIAPALAAYEAVRKPRIAMVAKRGDFNRFTWHASGPVAMARNFILQSKSPEALAKGLDPIYGYDAVAAISG